MQTPVSLRTLKSELQYQADKATGSTRPLDQEPHIIDYEYWYIIKNRYPYDTAFCEHDMILPRRIFATRRDISVAEAIELDTILDDLKHQYDIVFENLPHRRSVLTHYHLHLGLYHKTREAMTL